MGHRIEIEDRRVVFYDDDGRSVGIACPDTLNVNYNLTLPNAVPSANAVPVVGSNGAMSWLYLAGSGGNNDTITAGSAIVTSETGPTTYKVGYYPLTITGSPTGGTYTITVNGNTTAAIAYNAASSAVQSALNLVLPTGWEVEVTVGAGLNHYLYIGAPNGTTSVTVSVTGSFTGGTSPAINITFPEAWRDCSSPTLPVGSQYAHYVNPAEGLWGNGGTVSLWVMMAIPTRTGENTYKTWVRLVNGGDYAP